MAAGIPVQFISLSQSEYDNLGTKQDGRLYFTTDTHRIYKGSVRYIDIDGKLDSEKVGIPNGVSSLDGNGKVPVEQLPNIVGKTYDFSRNESIYEALKDLIVAFGGNVINMPEKEVL